MTHPKAVSFAQIPTQPDSVNRVLPTVPPAIQLARPAKKEFSKDQLLTLKLRTTPDDASSQTYELSVPFFRTGTPEEWLLVKRAIFKIFAGQNITTGPGQFAMVRRILEGKALASFNGHASLITNETVGNCRVCLQAVTTS